MANLYNTNSENPSLDSLSLENLADSPAGGYDSLLGCLMLACRTNQVTTSPDALVAGLPLRNGKMTPAVFKRAAERANLAVTTLKKSLNQIRSELLPVTLLLNNNEACKLVRINIKNRVLGS